MPEAGMIINRPYRQHNLGKFKVKYMSHMAQRPFYCRQFRISALTTGHEGRGLCARDVEYRLKDDNSNSKIWLHGGIHFQWKSEE